RGVAFGMFQNQRFMILLVGIIFMSVILFMIHKMPVNKKFIILHIVFSCIIAGGIGNMIDRISLGYVVDFISFVLINFPIFNVADCYVVCATIVLFIMFLFVLTEEDLDFISFKKAKEN
ncbi:MAG: signal peptidase II, partial [Lachnospiraceae bacterium]|nr:signal peptidase II [Lachnospiraceae bacterium]